MKKTILLLTAISAGALFFATAASAAAPTGSTDATKSEKLAATPRPNPSLPLKKGMTAQEVTERWGMPASVKPFPSTDGKAEVWTYYYTLSDQTTQVVTGTEMRLTYQGVGQGMGMVPESVYGLKHSEVQQVVKLLLYDGMLASWKRSIERKDSYQ